MISRPGPGGSGGPWALALEDSDRVETVRGLGINVPVVSVGLLVGGKPCSRTCESGAKCRDGVRRGPTLKVIRRSSHSEGQIELVGGARG